MASPIERNVMEDISRLACLAAITSGPVTVEASCGKPTAARPIHDPPKTTMRFNIRAPSSVCLEIDSNVIRMIPCYPSIVKHSLGRCRGYRRAVLEGKHRFIAAQSAFARRNVWLRNSSGSLAPQRQCVRVQGGHSLPGATSAREEGSD